MRELLNLLKQEISKCSREFEDFKIRYELSPTKEIDETLVDGSLCIRVFVDVSVERRNGEKFESTCLILNMPVRGKDGYVLNGSKVNIIHKETKSSGFAFVKGVLRDKSQLKASDWVEATPTRNVINPQFTKAFAIGLGASGLVISTKAGSGSGRRTVEIPLGMFLRAVTGASYQDLLEQFGFNHKHLITSLKGERTRLDSISAVAGALQIRVPNPSNMLEEIQNQFFSA